MEGFSILYLFSRGVGSFVYVSVYTHKHTLHVGYSDVSPGVRMRQLEGSKNPDGPNHGVYRKCVQTTRVID